MGGSTPSLWREAPRNQGPPASRAPRRAIPSGPQKDSSIKTRTTNNNISFVFFQAFSFGFRIFGYREGWHRLEGRRCAAFNYSPSRDPAIFVALFRCLHFCSYEDARGLQAQSHSNPSLWIDRERQPQVGIRSGGSGSSQGDAQRARRASEHVVNRISYCRECSTKFIASSTTYMVYSTKCVVYSMCYIVLSVCT